MAHARTYHPADDAGQRGPAPMLRNMYRRAGKRSLDLIVAGVALVVLSPLMLMAAAGVRVACGRPILFRQVRTGLDAKVFEIIKFRTMTDERDSHGVLLPDSDRLTPFGSLLRKSSVDELPELVNVLRGEMSLVGPRPLLVQYLPHYSEHERRRFTVKPGITGLAQISGRNDLSWEARLARDSWYAENYSLSLDLGILLKTVGQVVRARNIQVDPRSQMLDLDVARSDGNRD